MRSSWTVAFLRQREKPMMIETERLVLRHLEESDAPFILELLNDPSFLQYIGDKGVRTLDDARAYIRDGPVSSYATHGHGLNHVALKESGEAIGMCGLLRRPTLEHPDIGFAFLPTYWGQGYALEAAQAVMEHGRSVLGIEHVVAIASPDNVSSARLLNRVGLRLQEERDDGTGKPVAFFSPAQGSTTARS
jgi:[ribosomal protein S5]-alanine N-acetyltransferase